MNEYLLILLFNIMIIYISLDYNKNKHIYIILFVFLILYTIYNIYLKQNLIEGNIQQDIFKSVNIIKSDNDDDKSDLPLHKIAEVLDSLSKELSNKSNKCEGNFVINDSDKKCGSGFTERTYKITKQGDDCLHPDSYVEKIPLRFCRYGEECEIDIDCETRRCIDNLCAVSDNCTKEKFDDCDYDSCIGLNKGLKENIYSFENNKCNAKSCNESAYKLCKKDECNELSYKYKYNDDRKMCEKVIVNDLSGIDSYLNILKDYEDMGEYSTICNLEGLEGVKTCDVGEDLRPKYYCKDGYWNGPDNTRGSSSICVQCSEGTAGVNGMCYTCPDGQIPNDTLTECVPEPIPPPPNPSV